MKPEHYVTPDGKLTLIVESDGEEFTLWFEGYPARVFGLGIATLRHESDEETAVRDFLDELFRDEVPIVIRKNRDVILDVWPHDDPENDPPIDSPSPDESYELRLWSGAKKKA